MSAKTSTTSSFAAFARLLRYARGYRRQMIAATTCSIVNKLFDIAPEILIGIALDVVVNQENSFEASFGITESLDQILVLGVLIFHLVRRVLVRILLSDPLAQSGSEPLIRPTPRYLLARPEIGHGLF